jgi:hypothetical protein
MIDLMEQLRRRQATLVSQGQPEFPVTECFESNDYPVTFCYDVTSFEQSSLRSGGAGNSITLQLSIKAKAATPEYIFNFGTITIEGCDMLCTHPHRERGWWPSFAHVFFLRFQLVEVSQTCAVPTARARALDVGVKLDFGVPSVLSNRVRLLVVSLPFFPLSFSHRFLSPQAPMANLLHVYKHLAQSKFALLSQSMARVRTLYVGAWSFRVAHLTCCLTNRFDSVECCLEFK